MCGIFGTINLPLPARAVRAMLASLRHRGPDDWGLAISDPIPGARRAQTLQPRGTNTPWRAFERQGEDAAWQAAGGARLVLGHTRLSIVDPSHRSHQPFTQHDHTLIFNGEIYNFHELRRLLHDETTSFKTTGDTEVLLAAFRRWGARCVERLNGCYAFAIWDHRRGTLFAARDRLGKKPFYWWQDQPDRLAFASEIKTLWATGQLEAALDPGVSCRYLALGQLPAGDASFFAGLRQLEPASTLRWRPGTRPLIERYWSPPATFSEAPAAAASTLRGLLGESLRLRYRADVPVGLSLSGGVDSSSLAVAALRLRDARGQASVLTFSAVRGAGDKHDERREIEAVLATLPSEAVAATFLDLTADATVEHFREFLALHDEPMRDDGVFHQYLFMRRIRALGIKVILSGQGADELFAGYPWYLGPYARSLACRGHLFAARRWLAEIRHRNGRTGSGLLAEIAAQRWRARRARHKRARALSWLRAAAWDRHCAPAYRAAVSGERRWPHFQRAEIFSRSLPALLKDEDRNSMAHGIETRLPFLDHRVVQWALTLHPSMNFRGGHTKHLLRTAYADTLPAKVAFLKRKRGFYVSLAHRFPELDLLQHETLAAAEALEAMIDRRAFARLVAAQQVDRLLRWRVFNLASAWLRARARVAAAQTGSGPRTVAGS